MVASIFGGSEKVLASSPEQKFRPKGEMSEKQALRSLKKIPNFTNPIHCTVEEWVYMAKIGQKTQFNIVKHPKYASFTLFRGIFINLNKLS